MSPSDILLVDDEPSELLYTKTALETENYRVETANSVEEALGRISRSPSPSLIILDLLMPGMDGLQTLETCRKKHPEQKVIMISSLNDTSKVVRAIKLGASDYLTKPFQPQHLHEAVRRVLEANRETGAQGSSYTTRGDERLEDLDDEFFFLAASPVMKQIRDQVEFIAKVDVPVLLLGASGVGKEILARLIHKLSRRAHRPLIKVNCAALPADLLESELFGYEPGAFTGATRSKAGKFELAHKGTFLLDEIGEMSAALQAKLLHVLQDGEFSRLGGRANITADARVLAATNIDVERAIATRQLREDLYYRLNAFTITIPPLRDRREEIPVLLTCFMNKFAQKFHKNPLPISDRLVRECMRYHWPGNLRELGNFVKRYLVLEQEDLVVKELQAQTDERGTGVLSQPAAQADLKALVRNLKDETEAREIRRVLEDENWNRATAARRLRVSYKALSYKIRQHGLVSPSAQKSRLSAV